MVGIDLYDLQPTIKLVTKDFKGITMTVDSWRHFSENFHIIESFLDVGGTLTTLKTEDFVLDGTEMYDSRTIVIKKDDTCKIYLQKLTFDTLKGIAPILEQKIMYLLSLEPILHPMINSFTGLLLDKTRDEVINVSVLKEAIKMCNIQDFKRIQFQMSKIGPEISIITIQELFYEYYYLNSFAALHALIPKK